MNGRQEQLWRILDASALEIIGLTVLFAVAVWLIFRIRAWFLDGEDPAATDHFMLSQIAELKREGGLSDEEYRSIKGRLVNRIDKAMHNAGQQQNDASPNGVRSSQVDSSDQAGSGPERDE